MAFPMVRMKTGNARKIASDAALKLEAVSEEVTLMLAQGLVKIMTLALEMAKAVAAKINKFRDKGNGESSPLPFL